MRDPYEQDREYNAVGEYYATDERHYAAEGEYEDWMQLLLANWRRRMELERQKMLAAARETTQGKFLMDSLKDNEIIPRWTL